MEGYFELSVATSCGMEGGGHLAAKVAKAMAHNKNRCTLSKGASCSCAFDSRGRWTVTVDLNNSTATPYMEVGNGRCQRALLDLHPEAPQFALRGCVLIHLFLWKYRACN